jgi:hypothetical protein
MKSNLAMTFCMLCVFSFCCEAGAATISIGNAGFELPVLPDGNFSFSTDPYWTSPGSFGQIFIVNPSAGEISGGIVPEGQNVGASFVSGGTLTSLEQTLSATLSAGATYTLSVDVGNPLLGSGLLYAGYNVAFLAGSTILAQDNTSIAVPSGAFRTSSLTYTAPSTGPLLGQALTISLMSPGTVDDDAAFFDNVRLDATPVPEPGALCLAAIGLVSLFCCRWARFGAVV